MTIAQPLSIADQLREKVESLQSLILSNHPTLPVLLRQIHTQLRADPELVTTLSEEDVGKIVCGLKKQTNTEIAVTALKGTRGKSAKSMTLDDL